MSDNGKDWALHVKEMLEKAGFENVAVETAPVPEHILSELDNPEAAARILHFRVRTHLGKFGFMPTEDGVAIDLKDLGLTFGDLGENVKQDESNKDESLVIFRDPDDLSEFREFLEERKALN